MKQIVKLLLKLSMKELSCSYAIEETHIYRASKGNEMEELSNSRYDNTK